MADVLDRLNEMDRATTHWEGCEEDHIRCACAQEIRRLREGISEAVDELVQVPNQPPGDTPYWRAASILRSLERR